MSAWPTLQGRPKLSATTTAGEEPAASRISPLIRRADASLSSGSSETRPSSRLEESIPAFAATHPSLVSVISTPGSARTTRVLSREHQFDQRRILVDAVGKLPGPAARFHLREPSHPPLDLGHRFLGDDDDFVVRRSPGLRDQAAEDVSFTQIGQARERPDPQLTRNQG